MDAHQASHPSHLFTLRLWLENLGDGRTEWRGQVQHVLSGQVRYFCDWPTLIAHLMAMLAAEPETRQARKETEGEEFP